MVFVGVPRGVARDVPLDPVQAASTYAIVANVTTSATMVRGYDLML
jgi:hypothetical protein